MMQPNQKVILASASHARAQILDQVGLTYEQIPSDVDEDILKNKHQDITPIELAKILSDAKALSVSEKHMEEYVIAADQILQIDDLYFNKAKDKQDAFKQLQFLRGKEHALVNSISIYKAGEKVFAYQESAKLKMRHFSDEFITTYLDLMQDKALTSIGCYKIEGLGIHLFEQVDGNIFSIMGLPIIPILQFLREKHVIRS